MDNLALKVFTILRKTFFDDAGKSVLFDLREKFNTQDDPFDEYIASILDNELSSENARCQKASGPLISPDMVVYKVGLDTNNSNIDNNPNEIIGIEVKKLERGTNGKIARATGLDFNSTPPCGRIRIYSQNDSELIIKGYYLFACLERKNTGHYFVSAMTLCDGGIINNDFELYMQITGAREKGIGLGTYGDGANRNRPMLIFSNPLGANILDKRISLISELDLSSELGNIELAWNFVRKDTNNNNNQFFVYLDSRDIPFGHRAAQITEPFPTPIKRNAETQGRGKFKLNIKME
jgi:hypothetical protein